MKVQRIEWIDIAKFICLMCVMNSHLETNTYLLSLVFTPFFLTLFFFSSGYVYRHNYNFTKFLGKKITQLFIPWFVFSVLNIVLSQVISFNEHADFKSEFFWNLVQIRGKDDGLWFVSALFVTFIPFYFFINWFQKTSVKKKYCVIVVASLFLSIMSSYYYIAMDPTLLPWNSVALPWHLEYIFVAMFYMVLGYLFRTRFELFFDRYNTPRFRYAIWIVFLGTILLEYKIPSTGLRDIAMTYVCQILGIMAVISVCKVLPANKFVLYIGQNTLLCFALHGKVYGVLQTVFKKFMPILYQNILGNLFASTLFSIALTFALCGILIIPIWIINHWFPFLIGRKLIRKVGNHI